MTADDVVAFYSAMERIGVILWIDGGWAVDALLGERTRPHEDLDIALEERFVPAVRGFLESHGYRDVPRNDTRRWNFVLGDEHGRVIDIHSFIFDAGGNVVEGIAYPRDSLRGSGTIAGHAVRCITPEYLVNFHTGYSIDDNDRADVKALCERFGIELPPEYGS